MGFYVFADPPAQFRAWLARQVKPAAAPDNALFDEKCGACHAIRGTSAQSRVGPDLTHLASRTSLAALALPNTRAHLAQWIRDPQSVKPGSQMPSVQLTNGQIATLVGYLETLR
jgi:cytochrome c oxidase subunit 2